jgi:taurine transport system ATP-binding protein
VTAPLGERVTPAGVSDAGRGLRVRDVQHRFDGSTGPVHALGPIDVHIAEGSFVCVVGPSGCGKSTLLQVLAGLRTPTEGSVEHDARRVAGPSRRRGVVFQQSSSLYPWLTVRGNVELGLRIAGIRRGERRSRVDAELERVGLTDFADARIYELSGGMQQRCQIARALAVEPDVLLLDEPFGALDALTREVLQAELLTIWRATGRTVVFVTHGIEEAALLATRVLVMSPRPGRVIADLELPFSRSARSPIDLRSDPEFVATCRDLRHAITETP